MGGGKGHKARQGGGEQERDGGKGGTYARARLQTAAHLAHRHRQPRAQQGGDHPLQEVAPDWLPKTYWFNCVAPRLLVEYHRCCQEVTVRPLFFHPIYREIA